MPRRSIVIVFLSALVSSLRGLILVVVMLLLAPYALAYVEQPRGHAATAYVLRQSDILVQRAGDWLRGHVPTRIAGRDRTDLILGREVAFLSIDVVSSTAMKEREESAAIQYDFAEYRRLVEAVFATHDILKSAWTPDGVMGCFPDTDQAIAAGKAVILALDGFNRDVKLMREDFAVRCGVNAGYVHFDEATPLEAMSDRVIGDPHRSWNRVICTYNARCH